MEGHSGEFARPSASEEPHDRTISGDVKPGDHGSYDGPDADTAAAQASAERKKRIRGANWEHAETLKLVDTVKAIHLNGKLFDRKESKWQEVAEVLTRHNVDKDWKQAENRWGNLLQFYKKVKDWNAGEGHASYWVLSEKEKKEFGLPTKLPKDLFEKMDDLLAGRGAFHSSSGLQPLVAREVESRQDAPEANDEMEVEGGEEHGTGQWRHRDDNVLSSYPDRKRRRLNNGSDREELVPVSVVSELHRRNVEMVEKIDAKWREAVVTLQKQQLEHQESILKRCTDSMQAIIETFAKSLAEFAGRSGPPT